MVVSLNSRLESNKEEEEEVTGDRVRVCCRGESVERLPGSPTSTFLEREVPDWRERGSAYQRPRGV